MKLRFFLSLLLFGSMINPVLADDVPTCDELDEIADILDDVADELDSIGSIKEESETDKALGEVLDALEVLADVEENKRLSKSVKSMADAWEKLDWKTFKLSLDSLVANLDRIRRADCD